MTKLTGQIKEQIARSFLRIEGFEDPRKQLGEILGNISSKWATETASMETGSVENVMD